MQNRKCAETVCSAVFLSSPSLLSCRFEKERKHLCMYVNACHGVPVEVKGQFVEGVPSIT